MTDVNCRFMQNNLAVLTTGQITVSSELAAFQFSNVQNTFRSKIWKPSGHFLIEEDVNDKIYINDGSPKTATITFGDYDTPDDLATEIETQLNAISSGWTVNYNSVPGEYKFSIAHASAYTLVLSNQTEAIWDTIGFTNTIDQIISTEEFASDTRVHTDEYVIWDLGYNASIEFFAVICPLGEAFPISDTATVKLQANNINDFTSPQLDITLEITPGGILRFLDDIDDTGYRFWKFSFIERDAFNGPSGFNLSYIYLGDYLTLSRNISVGFQKTINDPSTRSESENGAIYFDQKVRYATFSNSGIQFLTKDDRDQLEQLYFNYGSTTPFFFSIDPSLCISNDLYDLTKYVIFDSAPVFTHIKGEYFNVSITFREIL